MLEREYVREQRQIVEDRRRKEGRVEGTTGSTKWNVMNEMAGDARGSEDHDDKGRERGDGRESVGEADERVKWAIEEGWFWRPREQQRKREQAVKEAARQQKEEQLQRRQDEAEQEAVRQRQ